jgi:hypothetical protein
MESHKYFDNFTLLYIIYAAIILLVIWLLLREVMNWYWKHNQMVSLMQEISEKLTRLDYSINKLNSKGKTENFDPDNTPKKEEDIKGKITEKKPKESIWTKDLF